MTLSALEVELLSSHDNKFNNTVKSQSDLRNMLGNVKNLCNADGV